MEQHALLAEIIAINPEKEARDLHDSKQKYIKRTWTMQTSDQKERYRNQIVEKIITQKSTFWRWHQRYHW